MKYAVMIDIDGDFQYVPEDTTSFKNYSDPKLFDTIEEAKVEQSKWNTGIVVDYITRDVIRTMTDEERKASLIRSLKNGV